jgi:DNA-binding transcriptional LysR family regulator
MFRAMPLLEASMVTGSGSELIGAVRGNWLDAAVVPLPGAVSGLRTTALGEQRPVAALPACHDHATRSELRLDQLAPERIVVLPRDANRPLYDAILACCHDAGLTPTLVEMPDEQVEQALLAVASGAGMALLPESVADRYSAPGVRFVPLAREPATFATAAVTRRETEHMPTIAFLREISAALATHTARPPGAALRPASSAPVGEPAKRSRR